MHTRFKKGSIFYQRYTNAITQTLEKGYAEPAPVDFWDVDNSLQWYLPHHAVLNPKKSDKFRLVFDCAAKCNGLSPNDMLYSGPDKTSNLSKVIMRFRNERTAIAANIEAMFMQVKVPHRDRDSLRFLW